MASPLAPAPMPPPDEPFPGLTGREIRIAVIDSGVHAGHDHIDGARIGPGVSILPDGSIADETVEDRLGHGTAVTAAIQEKAPGATCLPVRVFRDALKTSPAAILAAVRWSVAEGAQLVNLSLGAVGETRRDAFAALVAEAAEAGVTFISARSNEGMPHYPGALPGVIGVELDWDCPRSRYAAEPAPCGPVFRISGYPRPIPGVPPQRNLYGISFAVAQMTGFAARAAERLSAGGIAVDHRTLCNALESEAAAA